MEAREDGVWVELQEAEVERTVSDVMAETMVNWGVNRSSEWRLEKFFGASVQMIKLLARACGHTHLDQFEINDLTTWKRDVAYLTGVQYGGVTPL